MELQSDNFRLISRFAVFLLVLTFAGSHADAQTFRYGITGAIQSSHPKGFDSRVGFGAGLKGEALFSDRQHKAFLAFSLLYSGKGWKDEITEETGRIAFDWKCRLHYLVLPVLAGYKFAPNDRTSLFIGAGPYVAVGISGRSKFSGGGASGSYENPYTGNLFKNNYYKRFDAGAVCQAGVELCGHFQIALGYELSFIDPTKDRWKLLSAKDRTAHLSFTYLF